MVELNLEHLLNEISPEFPCGENLEEDSTFLKLEDEARFEEERQMGNSTIPPKEPDWNLVRNLSIELLERTKDIQIALHLTCSLVRTDGFKGLSQGLRLLKGWIEKYWNSVYPLQEPDDEYPVLRVNTLSSLNDYVLIRGPLNHIPLTQSAIGNFAWRDIQLAEGKIKPIKNEQQPEMSVIEAAFNDTDFAWLQNLASCVNQSVEQVTGISTVVIEKSDAVNAPDFSDLNSQLKGIAGLINEKIKQRELLEEKTDDMKITEDFSKNSGNTNKVNLQSGINNRTDVVRSLDEICEYFYRHEPSSPVPFLLIRAKKLLKMNFMEILRDMSPDSVNQVENICGIQNDDKD